MPHGNSVDYMPRKRFFKDIVRLLSPSRVQLWVLRFEFEFESESSGFESESSK